MLARLGSRQSRAHTVVGVAMYALFLVVAPFEHHDIVCHFKSPQHCTSCSSSVVGSDPDAPAALGTSDLIDVGRAIADCLLADGFLVGVRTTGRSPPAHL